MTAKPKKRRVRKQMEVKYIWREKGPAGATYSGMDAVLVERIGRKGRGK